MVSLSPRRTIVAAAVMVLLISSGPGRCQSDVQDDDEDYKYDCHPEEADTCFMDVNDNLMCNLGKPAGRNCTTRDAHDLCNGMSDALMCCEEIMDSCTENKGFNTFHVWLTGLRGVHHHLCVNDDHLALITDLLRGSKCFRLKKFIKCVEDRAQLTHVADLLTTALDLHECNKLQVSVAGCIEDTEKNKGRCRGTAQAVTEALITFFTSTACGHAPPPPPPCAAPSNVSGSRDDNNNSGNTPTTTNEANNTASNSSTNNISNINPTNNNSNSSNAQDKNNSISGNKNSTTTNTNNNNTNNHTSNNSSNSNSEKTPQSTSTTPVACQQTQKDLSTSGTPTASTVVVTVLVMVVLVGLAAVLLVKRGVLLIRTDLDRRLIGFSDGDANSTYDRF